MADNQNEASHITSIVVHAGKSQHSFAIFDNAACRNMVKEIVEGSTYKYVPLVQDVQTIVDVGANIGAAALYFSYRYPGASILAFEPFPDSFALMRRNLAHLRQVSLFDYGLLDRDCRIPMYKSRIDPETNSVLPSYLNSTDAVEITLKDAAAVFRENEVTSVDILKIDTEGCEIPILRSLSSWLPHTRAIYVEYHDEDDRRQIDAMVRETHFLCSARVLHAHRGELCFVSYDCFPSRQEVDGLRIKGDFVT